MDVWIWQQMLTPHMAYFAESLSRLGHSVTYIITELVSEKRRLSGWQVPELKNAKVEIVTNSDQIHSLLLSVTSNSVHLCEGLRRNGLVGTAQLILASRGFKYWIHMETLDDASFVGLIKRPFYRALLFLKRNEIAGVLAIGHRTVEWLINRGCSPDRVFPFAYFLQPIGLDERISRKASLMFRFIFVGRLISLKRLDLLFHALGCQSHDYELVVVGDGPMRSEWQRLGESLLPGMIQWNGKALMSEVPALISSADCLVLPSRHDGWGAVVSEALMMGTPAICSDACGSAEVVRCSEVGGVFRSGDPLSLSRLISRELAKGRMPLEERFQLSQWAQCLSAVSGAQYFDAILDSYYSKASARKPIPPWR